MFGQFLVEALELELEPEPDALVDPEVPELFEDGVVADEPDELLELVPLFPLPELDPDELVVAALATRAPPPTSPAVSALDGNHVAQAKFHKSVSPFCRVTPPTRVDTAQRAPRTCEQSYNPLGQLVEFACDQVTILRKWQSVWEKRSTWESGGEWRANGSAGAR